MRDRNTLYDRSGEVALGLILILILTSVFVAGLIALYLEKAEKFKVDESNVFLRTIKCAVIATGVSLSILVASGAGYILSNIFGISPHSGSNDVILHLEMLAPTAAELAFDLFVGLFIADHAQRRLEARMATGELTSIFASKTAFRLTLYFSLTTLATLVVSILHQGGGWHTLLAQIATKTIKATIAPIFEIIDFAIFVITHPDRIPYLVLNYVTSHMSNVFSWTPLIVNWLIILQILSVMGWAFRSLSRARA